MQAGPKPPGPPSTGSLHLPDDLDFDSLSLHSREPSPAVMLHPRSSQPAAAPADPSPWSDAPSPQGKLWEAPFPLVSLLQTGCEGSPCLALLGFVATALSNGLSRRTVDRTEALQRTDQT